jgi:hypothetical protein
MDDAAGRERTHGTAVPHQPRSGPPRPRRLLSVAASPRLAGRRRHHDHHEETRTQAQRTEKCSALLRSQILIVSRWRHRFDSLPSDGQVARGYDYVLPVVVL